MIKALKMGDVVSFDTDKVSGTGWIERVKDDCCDISTRTFKIKGSKNREEQSGPCIMENIPFDEIEIIDDDEWDDVFRRDYVESMIPNESSLEKLSEKDKERVRKHLEILCSHDDLSSLIKKGYLCYGGSPLYECNWKETVRCFEKALQAGFDAAVSDSLGYIYYYGRTTNGVPDYEKAYRYFSAAALAGNHESLYKVGDMFLKGLGVPSSPTLADKLYYRVYRESRAILLSRFRLNKFADAALRMASSYERNGYSNSMIYGKYLEANLGLRLRSEYRCFGDSVVRKAVDDGLEKCSMESIEYEEPEIFSLLDSNTLRGNLLFVKLKLCGEMMKGRVEVVSEGRRCKSEDAYLLLTIPSLSYCSFVRSFSFSCKFIASFPEIKEGEVLSFYSTGIDNDYDITFVGEDAEDSISILGDNWKIRKPGKRDEFQPEWQDEEER